jgi:hypothetical protein
VAAGAALPFRRAIVGQARSPAPLAGVMTGQRHESGAERQGANRNRVQAESGRREVSTRLPDAVTQRVVAATAQTRTQSRFSAGNVPPPKGPGRRNRPGRVRETRLRGASGTGKSRKTSSIKRLCKTQSPNCKANAA